MQSNETLDSSEVTPFSTVGYITYKRTYARRLNEGDKNSPTEEFTDTVNRVLRAAQEQLGVGFTSDEENRFRRYLLQLKGTVAGRFLWQLGTSTVSKLGLASLQNCGFVLVNEPVRPFTWTMDMLMLGCGVGYNIQRHNVDKLPVVNPHFEPPVRYDRNDADFIVPDSREGWVALLGKTLKSAFLSNKKSTFTYSTHCVRSKDTPIKGFGGTASGPESLCWGVEQISGVLQKRAGKKLRPIDALDIMNIIGAVVVAGNVRRCLPENTTVLTERGEVQISDVVVGDKVFVSPSGDTETVSNVFDQGVQKVYNVKLGNGDVIKGTENHRFAVWNVKTNAPEWVTVSELNTSFHKVLKPKVNKK